jgi:phosphopantothenoylcysteine decarboxylase/phosphopantothenate--cysteine ligase
MSSLLKNKRIVLGVTGSIASYKAADLASKLTQEGALVHVVLTRSAQEFVSPITFTSLTHQPTVTEMFAANSPQAIQHVSLARDGDILVIAPATAHVHGLADDMLTTTALATTAPILVAPAMDANMYENPVTQENVDILLKRGITIAGPAIGRMASGEVGLGRMLEVPELLEHICLILGRDGDLARRSIVVTAGGTQEPIDPVRMVANRSSGKMGFAVARAARDRGASVTLITAPTALPCPVGMNVVYVTTAEEMRDAVSDAVSGCDALVMAAAVADYRPTDESPQKIKKGAETWTLEMVKTPDILSEVKGDFVKVGFAAETDNTITNAREKLAKKGLQLIAANDVTDPEGGFSSDDNRITLIDAEGKTEELPLLPKYDVAHRILDRVVRLIPSR